MKRLFLIAVLCLCAGVSPLAAQDGGVEIEAPGLVLRDLPFSVTVRHTRADTAAAYVLRVGEQTYPLAFADGEARIADIRAAASPVELQVLEGGAVLAARTAPSMAGWLSILPALLAILMALLFRQVIAALFAGVWVGAWLVYGATLAGLWYGLLDSAQVYVLNALADPDHMAIILFSCMIGGMVGIISKNGGTMGIVHLVTQWARSARRGQVATAVLGCAIFFDDYANTLIVGNTMRPVTDRLRVSREKLAYIVDSTAAPVATLALVTTWIGFQVGVIGEAVAGIDGYDESAYGVFLSSLPYSFYPILALFFVFLVAGTGRDFGSMLVAERRARATGQLARPGAVVGTPDEDADDMDSKAGIPQRALNAVVPVLVLVGGTLFFIYQTGSEGAEGAPLREIIGNGDSYRALVWASLLAVLTAAVLSVAQRLLTLTEVVDAWYQGVKEMLVAVVILALAWALAEVNTVLQTADFLARTLGTALAPGYLPAIVFVLAALTAFATGSSWGVMGILMPLVIPLAWAILTAGGGAPESYAVIYASVSAVLAGAVWGDHCSPISDTTILSSMASSCDHIDHVRTQLPYALLVGVLSLFVLLPAGFGWPLWTLYLVGVGVLLGVNRFLARPVEEAPMDVAAT